MPHPGPTARLPAPRLALVAFAVGMVAAVVNVDRLDSPRLPGLHKDGVEYLRAAEALARDGSLDIPITHWSDADSATTLSHYPPGFPAALAIPIMAAGVSSDVSAVWVLSIGSGLTAAMVTWIAVSLGGMLGGGVVVALLGTNYLYNLLFLATWSETLYLPVCLALLWLLVRRPDRPGLHGAVALLGTTLRYVGLAGAVAAALFAWTRGGPMKRRLGGAAIAGGPSAIFYLAWSRIVTSDGEIVRDFRVYDEFLTPLADSYLRPIVEWWVPRFLQARLPAVSLAIFFLAAVAVIAVLTLRTRRTPDRDAPRPGELASGDDKGRPTEGRSAPVVAVVFSLCYIAIVILARALADPEIPIDGRIFSPLLVVATMAIGLGAAHTLERATVGLRVATAALLLLWVGAGTRDVAAMGPFYGADGLYYTQQAWSRDAGLERIVATAPDYRYVYSNEPHLLNVRTGIPASSLPRYFDDPARFAEAFAARPGPIVFLQPLGALDPPEAEVIADLDVVEVVRTPLSAVYVPRDAAAR